MKKNNPFIRSSEIKQWDYCPRQWYLLRTTGRKINTQAAKRGLEYHQKEAKGVKAVQKTQSLLITSILTGGIICLLWFLWQSR